MNTLLPAPAVPKHFTILYGKFNRSLVPPIQELFPVLPGNISLVGNPFRDSVPNFTVICRLTSFSRQLEFIFLLFSPSVSRTAYLKYWPYIDLADFCQQVRTQ
jgi:hypothetical protein